jgi:hypothetical protein
MKDAPSSAAMESDLNIACHQARHSPPPGGEGRGLPPVVHVLRSFRGGGLAKVGEDGLNTDSNLKFHPSSFPLALRCLWAKHGLFPSVKGLAYFAFWNAAAATPLSHQSEISCPQSEFPPANPGKLRQAQPDSTKLSLSREKNIL